MTHRTEHTETEHGHLWLPLKIEAFVASTNALLDVTHFERDLLQEAEDWVLAGFKTLADLPGLVA
jgi:hypothetical protein